MSKYYYTFAIFSVQSAMSDPSDYSQFFISTIYQKP